MRFRIYHLNKRWHWIALITRVPVRALRREAKRVQTEREEVWFGSQSGFVLLKDVRADVELVKTLSMRDAVVEVIGDTP